MIDRRKFIKSISALGISIPTMTSETFGKTKTVKKNNPIILCSRGEQWGRKVLKPGWDIFQTVNVAQRLIRRNKQWIQSTDS